MTDEINDFNASIIDEFRANEGRVGGMFAGATLLLLHHTGAKSGRPRVNPLGYRKEGDAWVVFGSKGGAPENPAWYHNLLVNPDVDIEVGTDSVPVRARVAEGEERERIWSAQKRDVPQFAEYEEKTTRPIPVVVLERR